MNVARILQEPRQVGSFPVAIYNDVIAMTKDVFVSAGGMWSLLTRAMLGATAWPTERAYASAASDYVTDARRVIDLIRAAAEDDRDVHGDPLASGWDDVVRRPHLLDEIGHSLPMTEGPRSVSSA